MEQLEPAGIAGCGFTHDCRRTQDSTLSPPSRPKLGEGNKHRAEEKERGSTVSTERPLTDVF